MGIVGGRLSHPARVALDDAGLLEGVEYSHVPALHELISLGIINTRTAAQGGEALLRYMHGLCGKLDEKTAWMAAMHGQLGALQCAIQSGPPLGTDAR